MSNFQTFTPEQIAFLRHGGKILRECLQETAKRVRAGITTGELDRFAEDFIRSHDGARPAFKGYQGFMGTLCTSVNDECVHGIPGDRVLRDGDIISLDGGVIYGELYTDACLSVPVGSVPQNVREFLDASSEAVERACRVAGPGVRVGDISSAIQEFVEGKGYSCVDGLTGHGLGSSLHQFPDVPNIGKAGKGPVLPPWTCIAIEPITAMGRSAIRELPDGWTIATADGSLSAHFEHTVLITPSGREILA